MYVFILMQIVKECSDEFIWNHPGRNPTGCMGVGASTSRDLLVVSRPKIGTTSAVADA